MKIIAIGEITSNFPSPATMFQFVAQSWQKQIACLFGPYRTERHYMRGPGPKWREKHGPMRA